MENIEPASGAEYLYTFEEMDEWFRTERDCRDYIRRLRWPGGFVCGRCGVVGEPLVMARGVFRCKACHGNTSLTAGTVFQDTRKPLRTWFLAMWFTTSQKNGVSALGLQRVLALGAGKTINGRKRDAFMEVDGRTLVLVPSEASVQDRNGAPGALSLSRKVFPFLEIEFVDSGCAIGN